LEQLSSVHREASARLAAKRGMVEIAHQHVANRTVRQLDPEYLSKRVDRLLKNPLIEKVLREAGVSEELRSSTPWSLSDRAQSELENVIGSADFMPVWFLTRGAELGRTVAKVRARTPGGAEASGTGFLVGPRLLLTNSHVLDWSDVGREPLASIAPQSLADFDFEERFNGQMVPTTTFRLDPGTLLLASPWNVLDYVLVALEPHAPGGAAIEDFGFNRLTGDLGKITKGEPVYLIQHPYGQAKKVVLQNNLLIDRDEALPYLTYEADTDNGSSGSPVFNRQWEVVGLHHSTEIARDGTGAVLAKNGQPWTPAMGMGQIKHLDLNEGIRISRIVADLAKKMQAIQTSAGTALGAPEQCSSTGAALLETLLATQANAPPPVIAAPTRPIAPAQPATGTRLGSGFPAAD
jgi:endonuclease G